MNEATAKYGVFQAMVDIIAAPGKALSEVKNHPNWFWWPMLTVIVVTIAVFGFYYTWVDFAWLVDEIVRTTVEPGADPAAEERIRGFMSPGMQIGMTAAGIAVVTVVIYAIQAAYLNIVNKLTGDPTIGYGQWFSFSAWTAFVGIFNALAALVVILLAENNQVGPDQLSPLSMNALFIHAEQGTSWATWGSSLTLVHLWMLALMAVGYSTWTRASIAKSAAIVVAPWALIFGIWALLI